MLSKFLSRFLQALLLFVVVGSAAAQSGGDGRVDYVLGAGDVVRIQVFQNNDLTVEARVSETGVISYPLLGGSGSGDCRRPMPSG
ncbi:MAG: polysaccharide biosynthesis/export family protein [Burkholderiaceae bacterium]